MTGFESGRSSYAQYSWDHFMHAYTLADPGRFTRIEVASPTVDDLGEGQVLLRVLAGAVCGTDVGPFRGQASPYYTTGKSGVTGVAGFPLHEVVGEVVASRDPSVPVGQRAVGWATAWNGLAELVISNGSSLIVVESDVDDASATVVQPLACVLYSVAQIPDIGDTRCAVIGQGPLGVLFSHVLKDRGAAHVAGIDLIDRSDVRTSFGVDRAVWSSSRSWAANISDSDRPQLIIEVVGHQVGTVNDAITAAAFGGYIFCFGVPDELTYPVEFERLFRKNLTLSGGAAVERTHWLTEAARYLERYPQLAKTYVTHVFSMSDVQSAFEAASRPSKGRLKVAIVA